MTNKPFQLTFYVKLVYTFLFLTLWTEHCLSQDSASPSTFNQWTYIGFTTSPGVNFTKVINRKGMPDELTFVPLFTYAFGFTVRKDISKQFSYQLGAAIERYGIRNQYGSGVSTTLFRHLKVPLTARYRFNRIIGKSRPFMELGGHFLFSPGANNTRFTAGGRRGDITWTANSYLRFNPSLTIGTERKTKRGYLFSLGLTYTLGITNLRDFDFVLRRGGQVLFSSPLQNRGTFLGLNCTIFLPPFGYKKLTRISTSSP